MYIHVFKHINLYLLTDEMRKYIEKSQSIYITVNIGYPWEWKYDRGVGREEGPYTFYIICFCLV